MAGFAARRLRYVFPAVLAALLASTGWSAGMGEKPKKLLYFTRSQGFEHDVVKRKDSQLAFSEKILVELGKKQGYEIIPSKDGALVTAGNLKQYDGFISYATGDWTKPGGDNQPPVPAGGKEALLEAVENGMAFIGIHAGNDAFRAKGRKPDPYIAMLGAQFLTHGRQQNSKILVASPKFPGMEGLGDGFAMVEEWYVPTNLAPDMHVILVQDTSSMEEPSYRERPAYPASWARLQGKGRVFYTSLGHREDVWNSPVFQNSLMKGIAWALGEIDYKIKPNIAEVTPEALKQHGAEK